VLHARIEKYRPEWLDELCLTGEIGWGRLYPTKRIPDRSRPIASLTRVVPVGLFLRSDLEWLETSANEADIETLSSPARQAHGLLEAHGAMFAADLLSATRMLPAQLNDVLGELVAQGLVTADGFAGLRALVAARSSNEESSRARPRLVRRRVPLAGSGRWSLWRRRLAPRSTANEDKETRRKGDDIAGEWAWQLLRRWGVVFRDLLEREPGAPKWFEILQVLRRLEARGEIRGGRFISGVAGEQFALGDTVRLLRQLRDEGSKQELVVISAADPLNLVGILTSHERVTSNASNRVAFLDGIPVAALIAREVRYLVEPTDHLRSLLQNGRILVRHERFAQDDESARANGEEPTPPNGKDAAKSKHRAQRSLFPQTIPRPIVR
jgi:ATP-dependent Lhr-like helicase